MCSMVVQSKRPSCDTGHGMHGFLNYQFKFELFKKTV